MNYSKLYENDGFAAASVALPNSLNDSFAEFDGRLVGPSRERQSSDGASNCVEAATGLSRRASDFDFANRDGFKIESCVEGSSSLDRIGEPENGFRSMPSGVRSSG